MTKRLTATLLLATPALFFFSACLGTQTSSEVVACACEGEGDPMDCCEVEEAGEEQAETCCTVD